MDKDKEKKEFDFSVLWKDQEEEGGLVKLAPIINMGLSFVILLMVFFK